MEYLDIINEKEELVGKEERTIAHAKHLLHRAVHILLETREGKIVCQLRKATKKQYPLHWSASAAGHVTSGESPEEAAKKELREELGVSVDLEFVGKFIVNDTVEYEMVYLYFGKSDGPFSPDQKEVEKINLFSRKELEVDSVNLKMTPHLHNAIKLLSNFI